jgi:four helix bundle protein
MRTKHFRELQIWQRSMQLARAIYAACAEFPKTEVFGLTSQMRRCAVSVPSNIAEGHGRLTDRAFAAFIGQARESLFELETQITLATDLDYLDREKGRELIVECQELTRMLNAFLKTLRKEELSHKAPFHQRSFAERFC